MISEPYLWDSQIIIFYSERYYSAFWDRKGPYQTWTPIDDKTKSLAARRNISVSLAEEGYYEVLAEEDHDRKSRLWYYGEVQSNN